MMAYSAQTSCRPFGSNKCPSHTGQEVSCVCMDCDGLVCMRCVTSKEHKGHVFEDLGDIVKEETDKLTHTLKINKENDLPAIIESISDVEEEIDKNKQKNSEISDLIKSRVREIKEEVDEQADTLIQECKSFEKTNHNQLLECHTTLTEQQRECKEQMEKIQKTLQSGTKIEVFDSRKLDKTYVVGSLETLHLESVTYQPRTSVPELVKQTLGSLANQPTISEDESRSEATLSFRVDNIRKLKETNLYSPPSMIRNIPWKVLVKPRFDSSKKKSLGFFVQCCGDSNSESWSCSASITCKLLNHKTSGTHLSRQIQHIFCKKEDAWGYSCFISWNEMMDTSRGFFKDEGISLEVYIKADAPDGVK
ncbi:ubiquitin carboxyl-terminal hydrolase 7-like [Pecten maximus]|uniref:ubiquitin carboxyl-terminal hydrolase 7-like n=1 Tax=Pecten maximus TaxID=6579 RepID=UPI001459069C|nr:ubiquitin carboxyl-terminal hydrolase 7-like [Pecten maximus]